MMHAILWCNGDIPDHSKIIPLLEGNVIFGVDGGAEKAESAGFKVTEVLGDLDSVKPEDWKGRSTLLPDESASDLVKSLRHLKTKGYDEVDIVGIEGGCPDHILGVWAALTEAPDGMSIRMHHEHGMTIRLHPNEDVFQLIIPEGVEFSVFALEECNSVSVKGSKWELDEEPLSFSTRGLHNQSVGEIISISADGILAIILHE
ncbi:MAG: thiamine diphosphokinase [Candidatus Thalassarchaeaceae archaeon]|nr:thiamine diphosphokinase [Candidatus Thalassarchaeaceae archaeon]